MTQKVGGILVFSQDHKVIALQYVCVALAIGLTGMFSRC